MKIINTWICLMSVSFVYGNKVCKTVDGYYCGFPFSYYWETHNICTQSYTSDQPRPWCYLNTSRWDYCTNECFECGVSDNVQNSCNIQISGKEGASSNVDFPWHVFIKQRNSERIICNGVIISSSRVLTTATCVKKFQTYQYYDVYAGSTTRFPVNGYQRGEIKNYKAHPGYNQETRENDIAIINIVKNFTWNDKVLPICYSPEYNLVGEDQQATFTGSKIVESYDKLRSIHYSIVHKVPNYFDPVCHKENFICTSKNNVNEEQNEGGPLTICYNSKKCVLVGILSRINLIRNTLVLTNVSAYIDWINQPFK